MVKWSFLRGVKKSEPISGLLIWTPMELSGKCMLCISWYNQLQFKACPMHSLLIDFVAKCNNLQVWKSGDFSITYCVKSCKKKQSANSIPPRSDQIRQILIWIKPFIFQTFMLNLKMKLSWPQENNSEENIMFGPKATICHFENAATQFWMEENLKKKECFFYPWR